MARAVCCERCQSIGLERYLNIGSVRLGLLLLCLFVVPGVFYFLWYACVGYWGCSTCGSRRVVPIFDPEDPETMRAFEHMREERLA